MAKSRAQLHRLNGRVDVHQDDIKEDFAGELLDESAGPLEESGRTVESSDEEEVDESVAEDIARFEDSFIGIDKRFRVINRIGEGTFSTVYKAEDLEYNKYENHWDLDEQEMRRCSSPGYRRRPSRRPHYVAIKKIYVTSSPIRIFNELELLHDLKDADSVCPLITAFRHQDQVVAVLPYFQHQDFRDYYRDMTVAEMRIYFRSLFTALRSTHAKKIIHRDVKPTNFLYNPKLNRGVLVDFGLAEREGSEWHQCVCGLAADVRRHRIAHSVYEQTRGAGNPVSYPKNETRSSRRANRAGTRGFRAPEVLVKCTQQTCSLDMWSAGVILLTMLSRRFPFFHSADDIDALLEITNIFGRKKMKETSILHGQVFETNIPSYSEHGHSLEKIILWCTGRAGEKSTNTPRQELEKDEKEAVQFLYKLMECDPTKRITAAQALSHPFIAKAFENDDYEVDMIGYN